LNKFLGLCIVLLFLCSYTTISAQPIKEGTIGCSNICVEGAIIKYIEADTVYLRAFSNVIDVTFDSSCDETLTIIVENIKVEGIQIEGIESFCIISPSKISFEVHVSGHAHIVISNVSERLDAFSFVVVGDNRDGPETFSELLKEIDSTNYAFCINTGDIVPSGRKEQFESFMSVVEGLSIPLYVSIGNHDLNNNSPELASEFLGDPTFSFDYCNTHFIILDNSKYTINDETYEWMRQSIFDSKMENVILVCHIPPFDPREGESHCLKGEDASKFIDFAADVGIDLVLCGHIHLYDYRSLKGVDYVISAGGGAPLYALESEGGFFHYIIVSVNGDTISHEVMKIISPSFTPEIAAERIQRAQAMYDESYKAYIQAKDQVDELIEKGIEMEYYSNMLNDAQSSLTMALSNLNAANEYNMNSFWHDSISSANTSYTYALHASVTIDSVLESLLTVDTGTNNIIILYASIVLIVIVIAIGIIKKRR